MCYAAKTPAVMLAPTVLSEYSCNRVYAEPLAQAKQSSKLILAGERAVNEAALTMYCTRAKVKAHSVLSHTVSEMWHTKPATPAADALSPQLRPPPLVAWLGKLAASHESLSSIQHLDLARHSHERFWLHPEAFEPHQTPCRPLVRATNTARSLASISCSVTITAATPLCEPAKHYTYKVLAKPGTVTDPSGPLLSCSF